MAETPSETSEPTAVDGPGHLRRFARRRQANASGGRQHSHRVKVTDAQHQALGQLAEQQSVSVPRLLVECALASGTGAAGQTPTARAEAMTELFALRRLMAQVGSNLNQVARVANSGAAEGLAAAEWVDLAAQNRGVVSSLGRLAGRIDDALDDLSADRRAAERAGRGAVERVG